MQVEGQHVGSLLPMMATGARVRNAYPIYRILGFSLAKARLIPDIAIISHEVLVKDLFRYAMRVRTIS